MLKISQAAIGGQRHYRCLGVAQIKVVWNGLPVGECSGGEGDAHEWGKTRGDGDFSPILGDSVRKNYCPNPYFSCPTGSGEDINWCEVLVIFEGILTAI